MAKRRARDARGRAAARRTLAVACVIACIAAADIASARPRTFDVPAGPLPNALILLGRQGGVTVVTGDPAAAKVSVPGVRGTLDVAAALHALLRGTGFEAVRKGAAEFVVRRTRSPASSTPTRPPVASPQTDSDPAIVVTAAKLRQPLQRFAGTVQVVDLDTPELRDTEVAGTDSLVAALPVLSSTGLGAGRDKIFARGIADSSFSGPTQATIGQYLGDVRLNYNAPDPDLPLYDISSVEVLEGPQATLYGAGSLGGVVRTVPRRPRTGRWEGSLMTSASSAANGRAGYEIAGVANAPITRDVAARLVGYSSTVPGLIDDTLRKLRAVDRMRTIGGRGAIAAQLGDAWSIEASGVYHRIDHEDAGYAEGAFARASRASVISQPAASTFTLGALSARRTRANGVEFVAVASVVSNDLMARYDLSSLSPGLRARQISDAHMFSGETRLSRSRDDGSDWLIGLHAVRSLSRAIEEIATDDDIQRTTSIRTRVLDTALFGEGTFGVAPRWTITVGARLSYARTKGEGRLVEVAPTHQASGPVSLAGPGTVRVLPSVAIGWHPDPAVTGYLRYQRGYRVGGLSVRSNESPAGDTPVFSIAAYRPDALDMVEAGFRFGQQRSSVFKGAIAVSASRWRDIQADLFDTIGPYTANIGNGRILSLEASGRWRPRPGWEFSLASFAAQARLVSGPTAQPSRDGRTLPNVPGITVRFDASKSFALNERWRGRVHAGLRYVGASRLGTGRDFAVRQGNYLDADVKADVGRADRTLFVEITNLFGVQGNRFALGNPYTAAAGDQRTPLHPRTIRIGSRILF